MTEQNTAPDLESAAQPHQPEGAGHRPPAANQRGGEPVAPGTSEDAPAVDDTNPATPVLPQSGAHRAAAPSGEVAPT